MDEEKVITWLKKGATPSDTAKILMKKTGIFGKLKETA
jgi:ribosomal protein S16